MKGLKELTKGKGRLAQKQRTREAILAGARKLIEEGRPVTVTDAAEVQGISKATAYRYFSDPNVLVAEAGLAVAVAPYEDIIGSAATLRARLAALAIYPFDLAVSNEHAFRIFLGTTLAAGVHSNVELKRGARRIPMFERAFAESSEQVAPAKRQKLIRALSTVTGIEAMVSLYDIVGADPKTARATVIDIIEAVLDRHLGHV